MTESGATWAVLLLNLAVACTNIGRLAEAERHLVGSERHAAEHHLDLLRAHAQFNRAYLERLEGSFAVHGR